MSKQTLEEIVKENFPFYLGDKDGFPVYIEGSPAHEQAVRNMTIAIKARLKKCLPKKRTLEWQDSHPYTIRDKGFNLCRSETEKRIDNL